MIKPRAEMAEEFADENGFDEPYDMQLFVDLLARRDEMVVEEIAERIAQFRDTQFSPPIENASAFAKAIQELPGLVCNDILIILSALKGKLR